MSRLPRPPSLADEVAPLPVRLRWMQLFRVVAAGLVVGTRLAFPDLVRGTVARPAVPAAVYLGLVAVAEIVWRLWPRYGRAWFGGLLLLDGVFLAWVAQETGGVGSPLSYLVLVHLVMVTLLASYRTGVKIALWDSLLLIAAYYAEAAGHLPESPRVLAGGLSNYQYMVAFIVVLWSVTITTATFSAISERELRHRRFESATLAGMADELAAEHEPRAVAEALLGSLCKAFDCERGIVLANISGDLDVVAGRGNDVAGGPVASRGTVVERASSTGRAVLVKGLEGGHDNALGELLRDARNVLVVPMIAYGLPVGAVLLERGTDRGNRIPQRVVSMVEQFVSHAALALRNALLVEELKVLAETDGLTKLANRRSFELVLRREIGRARLSSEPVSLLLIDLDRFKRFNDSYGHQLGDEVLRRVGEVLLASFRDLDTTARYGGEEFAVIIPSCPPHEALAAAERLRQGLSGVESPEPVAASVGVATYPANAADAAGLVTAADRALYDAKRRGRNQAVVSTRICEDDGVPAAV